MRRFSAVSALLFLLITPKPGAQVRLNDIRFVPPTFFVGDLVELKITMETENPSAVEVPGTLPSADWVEIRDIGVESEETTVTVTIAFTPFAAGIRALPTVNLGAFQLRDIKVPTHSVLPAAHGGVRRLRGQLVLPGTRLALALILGLLAMAPFLIYGVSRLFWNWFVLSREVFRIHRPARRLRQVLRKLRTGVGSESASTWFSQLTDGLRTYLTERTGHDCRTATTGEIAVMTEFSQASSPAGRLLEVLHDGDMVKFAGHFADARTLERTLNLVESAVVDWEKSHVRL